MSGQKIIDGLKDAVAGNFSRVTIGDQVWVREEYGDTCTEDQKVAILNELETENGRLVSALEKIALLDEADGHELTADHALRAIAIATSTLGKHPSVFHCIKCYRVMRDGDCAEDQCPYAALNTRQRG